MDLLIEGFGQVKIDLVKIESTLDNIKSKQSDASSNIKEAKNLAFSNQERITKHEHEISNLKHGTQQLTDIVIKNKDKIKEIDDTLLLIQSKTIK